MFRYGVGAGVLGVHRSAEIEGWVPVFLFAVLFGLSIDYEVFLVSRMREEWDARRDNAAAVAFGLERTGRLITAAALMMAIAFGGFVAGSVPGLQQIRPRSRARRPHRRDARAGAPRPVVHGDPGRWNWWLPPRIAHVSPRLRPPRLQEALDET